MGRRAARNGRGVTRLQLGSSKTRVALSRVARPHPAGADLYWTLG